ncbi:Lrp/AsnC family transcriptional regulator [Oxyplasma meridianum]|uniref:Lrp/AsnC family transcriptional regulator n=1 Tax=Oxyplasma meridianum TaxID=3073602 RepID=A0AAX4NFS2_9ARCH
MDQKDHLIMEYLKEDGRAKISDISRELNIPRITVYERIQAMIKSGLIKKFTIVPDYSELGIPVIAYIFILFDSSKGLSQRELAKRISKIPEVEEVHIVAGVWDILIKVRARSMEDIGNFVLDKLRSIDGIDKTETVTIFSTVK